MFYSFIVIHCVLRSDSKGFREFLRNFYKIIIATNFLYIDDDHNSPTPDQVQIMQTNNCSTTKIVWYNALITYSWGIAMQLSYITPGGTWSTANYLLCRCQTIFYSAFETRSATWGVHASQTMLGQGILFQTKSMRYMNNVCLWEILKDNLIKILLFIVFSKLRTKIIFIIVRTACLQWHQNCC